jgi:hypothetical protein
VKVEYRLEDGKKSYVAGQRRHMVKLEEIAKARAAADAAKAPAKKAK